MNSLHNRHTCSATYLVDEGHWYESHCVEWIVMDALLTQRRQCLKIFPRFQFGAVSTSEWQPAAAALQVPDHIVAFPPNFPCHSSGRNRRTGGVQSHRTHRRRFPQQFDLFQGAKSYNAELNCVSIINKQPVKEKGGKKGVNIKKSAGNTKTF